jgi:hypothetical protein
MIECQDQWFQHLSDWPLAFAVAAIAISVAAAIWGICWMIAHF